MTFPCSQIARPACRRLLATLTAALAVLWGALSSPTVSRAQDSNTPEPTSLEIVRERFAEELLTRDERAAWRRVRLGGTQNAPPVVVACGIATAAAWVAANLPDLLDIGPAVRVPRRLGPDAALGLVEHFEDAALRASQEAERATGDLADRLSAAYDALTAASTAIGYCDAELADETAALDSLIATVQGAITAGAGRTVLRAVLRVYEETAERARRAPRSGESNRDAYARFD